MSVDTHSRAVEQAVLARVRTQLPLLGDTTVIGVRCQPGFRWEGETRIALDGQQVRVQVCPSVLAVLAALVADDGAGVLVFVTPVDDRELGPDVLARVHRHQLLEASRQTLLHDLAGGRALDAGIVRTGWLADALVTHFAEAGADLRDRAVPLTRQDAVELLLKARLGLDPSTLDATTAVGQAVDARTWWATVDPGLRDHLIAEAGDRWGELVRTVLRMAARSDQLLSGLLLLDVVGSPHDVHAAAAAGGVLVNELLGSMQLDDELRHALCAGAVQLVRERRTEPVVISAVDTAEARATTLGIGHLVGASDVLPSGLDRRFDAAARDLTDAALEDLSDHFDARQPYHRARVERVRCALRLHRWSARTAEPVTDVASSLQHYLDDGGWVDRALEELRLGDSTTSVRELFDRTRQLVVERRDATDRDTAGRLAAAATGALGSVTPVERVLHDVVAPLVGSADSRVLLVVLDGMSAATAVGLAADLTEPGGQWTEVVRRDNGGRRLPVLTTLPSETTYSRTSLLTGTLRTGTSTDERAAFGGLAVWSGRSAALFHRADLAGVAGGDLGPDLARALDRHDQDVAVVGVVLNTIDDALTKGVQGAAHLAVDDIDWLRALLIRASYAARTVVFVSDHGHVLHREQSELRFVAGGGARWRPVGSGPVVGDEIRVTGPRVLTADHTGVFASTPGLRYSKATHGYHGGVALAEIMVPLLVFVPAGRPAPAGWSLAGPMAPDWWTGDIRSEASPAPGSSRGVPPPLRAAVDPDLFEAAGRSAPASVPVPGRGASLVRSKAYAATAERVPAPMRLEAAGVGRLLDAAIAAGGTIGYAEAVDSLGTAGRAERGVFQALRRLLNVEGYEVVSLSESERSLTINRQLLDDQFPARP